DDDDHGRAPRTGGHRARQQRLARGHPGARRRVRRGDRRPPVDPRRRRARQGREPLRWPDRPRLPHPLAPGAADRAGPRRHRHRHGRQLRPEQGPLPLAGAGGRQGAADREPEVGRGGHRRAAADPVGPHRARGRRQAGLHRRAGLPLLRRL
ncbi:MAG: Acyl dehydratase, partial [uncultured Blastococcus sp.]